MLELSSVMHEYRHRCQRLVKRVALFSIILIGLGLTGCSVYTINKSHLENKLSLKDNCHKTFNMLTSTYSKQFVNNMDTLPCADADGRIRTKRFNYDSKIKIVTHKNKKIKFYAKTLYIWKGQFLIGERTAPTLYGPNYFPVRLSDIARIEVKRPWF
jgi:hypothetical protein